MQLPGLRHVKAGAVRAIPLSLELEQLAAAVGAAPRPQAEVPRHPAGRAAAVKTNAAGRYVRVPAGRGTGWVRSGEHLAGIGLAPNRTPFRHRRTDAAARTRQAFRKRLRMFRKRFGRDAADAGRVAYGSAPASRSAAIKIISR